MFASYGFRCIAECCLPRLAVFVLGMAALAAAGMAHAFDANDGFAPNADQSALAVVVQPDGKTIYGGVFTQINGQACAAVCRVNTDGSVDASFAAPSISGAVLALALQPDGKLLIGGSATGIGGARNYLARLNADGSLDAGFADVGSDSSIWAIAVQADGKVLVGGLFTTIGGQTRHGVARLNSDGSLDTVFPDDGLDANLKSMALQQDGKILIGGVFTMVAGQPRHALARLNTNGTLDTNFADPNVGYTGQSIAPQVLALAVQVDGKILAGGTFTSVGGQTNNYVARINADGTVDNTFAYAGAQTVYIDALALQPDGKLIIGGHQGDQFVNQGLLARLNADGSVESSVIVGPVGSVGGYVTGLAQQPDGKVVIGGTFDSISGQPLNNLARLYTGGTLSLDTTVVDPAAGNAVYAIATQPDDTLLVGGQFTTIGSTTRNHLARLDSAGKPDPLFPDPQINNMVYAIAVQPDRRLLIGGAFSIVGGHDAPYIARVNSNGSFDSSFPNSGANGNIYAIALHPSEKLLLIGGDFTTIHSTPRGRLARLNVVDGSLDTSFPDVKADGAIRAIAFQDDGKVLIGGAFTTIGGTPMHGLARLNTNGTLDTTFPDLNVAYPGQSITPIVLTLAQHHDGKVIVGGEFTAIGGQMVQNLARINADGTVDNTFVYADAQTVYIDALALQADGKLVIGGQQGNQFVNQGLLARLNADGSVESSVIVGPVGSVGAYVTGLAQQPDGKILAGGYFNAIGGQTRANLVRLATPEPALQSLSTNATGDTVTWLRSGASPELVAVPQLQYGASFANAVYLSPIAGGWRAGMIAPMDQLYDVRVQGHAAGGTCDGSEGLIETVLETYVHDKVFANGFE